MNKIYKLIWSQTANAFVAVSELASARGKSSSTTNNAVSSADKKAGIFKPVKTALVLSMLFVLPHSVMAGSGLAGGTATGIEALAVGESANATGIKSVAIGPEAQALGDDSLAVGTRAKALVNYSTALGNQSTAEKEYDLAAGYNAIASGGQSAAVGFAAKSTGTASNAIGGSSVAAGEYSTALGQEAQAKADYTLAAGYKANASGGQSTAVGFGSQSTGTASNAIGGSSVAAGEYSTALGQEAHAKADFTLAAGYKANASGGQSTAVGFGSKSTGNAATALGSASVAAGDFSIAIGQESKTAAGQNFATALGYKSNASGWASFAQGSFASASGDGSISMGDSSSATGKNATAIGGKASATSEGAQALGYQSNASGYQSNAIGAQAAASGNQSNAIGAQAAASGIASNAIGWKANAMAQDATAIGTEAKAQAARSIAMGYQSTTNAAGPSMFSTASIAIGEMASTDNRSSENTNNLTKNQYNRESIAIGAKAKAFGDQSTALGNDVKASGNSSIAIGGDDIDKVREKHGDLYWRITGQNMPSGYVSTESSGAGATAIGVMTTASGHFASALGMTANASGNGSVALGPTAESSGEAGVAIGIASQASSIKTIAIGSVATATAENATAMGYQSKASGIASNAIGRKANATAQNATAIGFGAKAYSGSGIAMGTNAEAGSAGSENTLVQAVAIGRDAKAKAQSQDVALGAYSETSAVANTQNTQIDGKTYTYAGTNAKSTLSVGKSGAERTITNVAAGRISGTSTDAINGSQLYGTNQAINSLAGDVDTLGNTTAAAIGGNSTYNPSNHTVSVPTYNINNQNVSTVSGAINKLNEGWNLTSNGNSTAAVRTNDTVDIGTATGETNLIVAKNGNTIDYSLNKKLDLGATGSVNAGGTVINNNGLSFVDSNGATLANTPSIKKDGINAGGQQIANVKAGTGDTDAVNVSQLKAAQAAATTKVEGDKGVSVTPKTNADGSTTYTVAAKTDNTTVKVDGNGNIAAVTTPLTNTDGKVNTPAAPNALATAGDIANAINNSGWKLAADGTTGTELINPSDTVTFKTGSSNLTVKRDGANITYDLAKDININSVQIGANGPTIKADASNNINIAKSDGSPTKITNVEAGTGDNDAVNVSQLKAAKSTVEGDKGVSVTPKTNNDGSTTYTVAAKTDGTTVKVDGNGNIAAVTTTFTPSTDGKVGAPVGNGDSLVTANTVANAINNSGWKLAADGTTGTELINPSDTVTFKTGSSNLTVKRDGANITYDLAKDININSVQIGANGPTIKADASNNINIAKSDGSATKITNVEAGTGDNDAVNVSQLKAAQAAATTKVEGDKGVSVTPTTNADGSTTYTVAAKTDGTTVKVDDNGNIAAVTAPLTYTDGKVNTPAAPNALATAGDIANAINNSGWKLAADGTSGTELINPSDTVTFKTGSSNLTVKRDGANIAYDLAKDININSVNVGDTVKINKDGINAGNTVIDGVKSGNIAAGSGQAVNGGQVHNIAESIADALGGESKVNADGSIAKPTYTITKTDGTTVTANSVGGALNYFNKEIVKPITFAGDSGSYEAQLGHTVNVKGDGKNITTSVSGNNLTIKMTDTPEFSSVTTGGTVMNSNGITTGNGKGPSLTTTGINAAGTKITNVANGTEAGDAVNYGQLSAVSNNLNNRINDVDRSSRAGIAGALATAGLYQAYLPGKSMVSVGGGTFRGENAVAIGLSRISDNGKIGIKLSGMSTSQGDTGGSVSVGYQW